MSLLPFFDDFNYISRPSRLLDQHFGLGLTPEDLLEPMTVPRYLTRCPAGYMRPWRSAASHLDEGSTIQFGKDKFNVNLDVQQFKPEEIKVKVVGDNTLMVEAKHEEKEDEHGFISRHFVRKYVVPKNYDISQISSKLSSDGVLSISAPNVDDNAIEHREIPIEKTGEPVRKIEQKKDVEK
ncbi:protein lethal(2)essential for life-like [Aethina tumida]|uniref:protein lethal(2)essential for life-like n=1 Tax=Aethina tumida TaxID=116153 RepID=UPI00096B5037|nr:protein lethal(2)essential for life-like [Aethina tumida]